MSPDETVRLVRFNSADIPGSPYPWHLPDVECAYLGCESAVFVRLDAVLELLREELGGMDHGMDDGGDDVSYLSGFGDAMDMIAAHFGEREEGSR